MAAAAILDFENLKNLTADTLWRANLHHMQNFIEIGPAIAVEISRFFDFSRWRPSAILDLFVAYLDHPRRVFGGLYLCAKFGCNGFSSFDNMKVSIFYVFGMKTPIHGPKIGVLGAFDPLNGQRCHRHPQKALPWAETRHMAYRSSKSVKCL